MREHLIRLTFPNDVKNKRKSFRRVPFYFCLSSFVQKRLHKKELTSRSVGLRFHGLKALSLSLLGTPGTAADKKGKERKI